VSIWSWFSSWRTSGLTAKDERLYQHLGGAQSYTDEIVNSASVLGLSTAWACVTLLSGTISSLSLDVYKKEAGIKRPAASHPLQAVLSDPNADQTDIDFWEFMSLSLELWGNAYAHIARRSDGSIISLTPLRPEIVGVYRDDNGAIRYRWYERGQQFDENEGAVFHVRGIGGDPLGGMSPISWHRNVFGNAQAIERASGTTFKNGVRPSGVMSTEKAFSGPQRSEAETLLREKYSGAMNAGVPMLLDNGLKWESITFNPEEAQMLQSRGFSVEEICRIFGVPPFMVGHTEKVTSFGSGLEQQILGFQKFTLRKRLKKIERAIRKQLMTPADRAAGFSVSFNLEDLLRGDSVARARFYRTLLEVGVITINEVRALEGLAPIEGGDVPRMQQQNVPIVGPRHNGGPPLENAA
jgi:HK97 family phage portal protein